MNQTFLHKVIDNHTKSIDYNEFQAFCNRLLIKLYPNEFIPVRAGGIYGDMKNDGYCYNSRTFFQCHATRKPNTRNIMEKIERDLKGCLEKQRDVEEFVFITNDVNLGKIEHFIDGLRSRYDLDIDVWNSLRISEKIKSFKTADIEFILNVPIRNFIEDLNDLRIVPIEYTVDQSSIKEFNFYSQRKFFFLNFLIAGDVLLGMSIMLFIFSFDFPIVLIGIAICTLMILWLFVTNSFIFQLITMPLNEKKEVLIESLYYCRQTNSQIISYSKSANCLFQKCEGKIVTKQPPKTDTRFEIIGQCTLNPKTHTYTIDKNNIGYHEKIEFIEQKVEVNNYYNR